MGSNQKKIVLVYDIIYQSPTVLDKCIQSFILFLLMYELEI